MLCLPNFILIIQWESVQNRVVKLGDGGVMQGGWEIHPEVNLHTKFYPNRTMETCSNSGGGGVKSDKY